MPQSLQKKLVWPLMLTGVVAAIISTLVGTYLYNARLSDYVLNRAETIASAVQFAAESYDKVSEINRIVSALGGEKHVNLIVVVFGEPAEVIASTRGEWIGMRLAELPYQGVADDLAEAIATRRGHRHIHSDTRELDYTVPLQRHVDGSTRVLLGAAMVHLDTTEIQRDVWWNAVQQSSVIVFIIFLLTATMWYLVRRHVLRPAQQLEQVLQAQASGQRETYPFTRTDDEIGRLASELDQLLRYRNQSEVALNLARDQAETAFEEVRGVQHRLQIATKAGGFGIWDWDVERDHLIWDDRMYELFGRLRHDTVTSSLVLEKYLSDSERERVMNDYARAVNQGGAGFSQEFVIRREDGKSARLRDEALFVRNDSGNVKRVIGISWDVTAQYEAQQEQQKLALVAQHANNLFVITDRQFGVEWVNPAFERFTGFSLTDIRSHHPIHLLQGPDTDLQTLAQLDSAIAQRAVMHAEILLYRKNQQPFWIDLEVMPILSADRLTRFVLIANVATERIKAQLELQRTLHELEQQRFAFDEHAIVAVTDPAGRLTYVNDKFCAISQYRRDELIGQNQRIVNSGFHSREFWQQFWQTISSGQVWKGAIKNKRKGGDYYWVETTVVPFVNESGKPYQYIALRMDITERVAMEEEIQMAMERAELANRSKSEFLANMSHEIRTPMNAVLGLSEMLRDTPLDEQQRDYVNTIYNAGDALLTIINDILDFSKIEAGKMELSVIPFDLERSLYEVLRMLTIRAQEKNLELILDYDAGAPRRFVADPVRLRQVLLNLLSNAVKFTSTGHVRASVRARSWDKQKAQLRIEVEDTGIGIDAQTQAKLFQSFTQADASISRQFGGTGLGLAISKRIVELMGGSLGLVSTVGKGSTFFIELDLPLAEQQVWAEQQGALHGETVWLMEPHLLARLVLERQLTACGVNVQTIETVDALQRALVELNNETLFVDADIAVTAGVLSWWRAQKPAAALVILSSQGLRGEAAQYRDIKACAYVHKPTDSETLIHSLRMVLAARDQTQTPLITKHVVDEQLDQPRDLQFDARVLVAEDVIANQIVIRAMLNKCGVKVEFANNGVEAINRVQREPFDLVFMDCQMPVLDGLSATQQIRQLLPTRIPIIALTANALQDDRGRCLDAGMDDFLAKPVKRKLLQEVLAKWLPGKIVLNS